MAEGNFVADYRVSTAKQGASRLGLAGEALLISLKAARTISFYCSSLPKSISMTKKPMPSPSPAWRAGQRVARIQDHGDQGTIVEANGKIKVRWDSGRTSYFRRNKPANVQIAKPKE